MRAFAFSRVATPLIAKCHVHGARDRQQQSSLTHFVALWRRLACRHHRLNRGPPVAASLWRVDDSGSPPGTRGHGTGAVTSPQCIRCAIVSPTREAGRIQVLPICSRPIAPMLSRCPTSLVPYCDYFGDGSLNCRGGMDSHPVDALRVGSCRPCHHARPGAEQANRCTLHCWSVAPRYVHTSRSATRRVAIGHDGADRDM